MLPGLGIPRVTISPNTGGSLRASHGHAKPPASSEANRSRRNRPQRSTGCCAATLAQPTRKSLDGIKPFESSNVRPEASIEDVQTLHVANNASELALSHSASAASLASEDDLALLLGSSHLADTGASLALVFGRFPPVQCELAEPARNANRTAAPTPQLPKEATLNKKDRAASKLKATSHEFYPKAYLAAAAATALAARTLGSSIAASISPATAAEQASKPIVDNQRSFDGSDVLSEEPAPSQMTTSASPEPVEAMGAAVASSAADSSNPDGMITSTRAMEQQQQQQSSQYQQSAHSTEQMAVGPEQQQQQPQQYWVVAQQTYPEQYWQQPWQWQQWHEQQQQQPPQAHLVPYPVLVPVYVQPYTYHTYTQQVPVMPYMPPASAAPMAAHDQQQCQQEPQQQLLSPQATPSSLATVSSSTDVSSPFAVAPQDVAFVPGQQHLSPASQPPSRAGSIISAVSAASHRQRQHQVAEAAARAAGAVTVSPLSSVKDAAGALAKVLTRHGQSLLLTLVKPEDDMAQATHVAAKSLAVARFYINAHMAAAGAAGINAAAALTGVDQPEVCAQDATSPAAAVNDEVVFMPYHCTSTSTSSSVSSRSYSDAADVSLGFLVAKASSSDLQVLLPPPVGVPACMQGKVPQQSGQQRLAGPMPRAGDNESRNSSSVPLLKAGANTDVNKLSNAVIHNIMGSGHVAMQLAGAAACHVAMRSLVKARDRLLRKFNTDIVATASFANEDTSSSIGRNTVFLRLDIMRSNLLQAVTDGVAVVSQAVKGQQQQQQEKVAFA